MATVATQLNSGSGFASGEVVTATKLNNLVNTATVTFSTSSDTDDSTLEISGGRFRVKDGGITAAKMATGTSLPAGAIMPFAMNSAPSGWLAADGSAVGRSTYSALFAAIGTAHGSGDGSTTFNLPDLRGIFVRGSGSQTISGTTYSGTFASKQQDQLRSHTHTESAYSFGTYSVSGGGAANINSVTGSSPNTGPASPSGSGSTLVGSETQPANIALLYCIKF